MQLLWSVVAHVRGRAVLPKDDLVPLEPVYIHLGGRNEIIFEPLLVPLIVSRW